MEVRGTSTIAASRGCSFTQKIFTVPVSQAKSSIGVVDVRGMEALHIRVLPMKSLLLASHKAAEDCSVYIAE